MEKRKLLPTEDSPNQPPDFDFKIFESPPSIKPNTPDISPSSSDVSFRINTTEKSSTPNSSTPPDNENQYSSTSEL